MELKITALDGKESGSVQLSDEIFGLEPRIDLIQRCVRWQLARRQAGTHKVKNRSEIWRTGKKIYRQKGTGGARHGSARANLFRGGGRSFGPTPRSHAHDLPKKVRALALRHALSAKAKDGGIVVIEQVAFEEGKTKALKDRFGKLGWGNALIIDGVAVDEKFALAARNIPHVDVLPVQGINVYDILRRETLVLTRAAVDALQARFSGDDGRPRTRVGKMAAKAGLAVASGAAAVASGAKAAGGSVADAASSVGSSVAEAAGAVGSAVAGKDEGTEADKK
jgi:large subunit ribosomal protein L4